MWSVESLSVVGWVAPLQTVWHSTAQLRARLLLLQCHSAEDSEAGPRVGTELQVSVSHIQGTWRLPYILPWSKVILSS